MLDRVQDYDAALDPDIAGDDAYDFTSNSSEDATEDRRGRRPGFVRLDALEPEHRDQVERVMTINREKQVLLE